LPPPARATPARKSPSSTCAISRCRFTTATSKSASPGALGGLRGLVQVRSILGNIKVLVLPDQIAVSKAHEAFNPDGSLKDAKQHAAIGKLGAALAATLAKLKA
jgi:hypothetical protein